MGNRSKKVEGGGPELLTGRPQAIMAVERLLGIMAALRDPERGCPWDRKQTFATIAPYTIEEAYEVAEAARSGDLNHLKEELGDLLLQPVFHAEIASETGAFTLDDSARRAGRAAHAPAGRLAGSAGGRLDPRCLSGCFR